MKIISFIEKNKLVNGRNFAVAPSSIVHSTYSMYTYARMYYKGRYCVVAPVDWFIFFNEADYFHNNYFALSIICSSDSDVFFATALTYKVYLLSLCVYL